MEKILNLLKDNQALRTLDTDKGTIVTNSTSDEAISLLVVFGIIQEKS